MVDHIASFGLKVGSFVAPIWGGAGGGSAMGDADDRKRFVTQVRKASAIGEQMREMGIRPTGGIRIDSSVGVEAWDKDPKGNTKKIAETFREAAKAAQDHGEFLVAEGEICWGGMHSWRENVNLLEDGRYAGRRRLPGRHGAFDALHARLQCREGPAAAEGLRLEGPARSSTPPTRRSPMRCGRGPTISTSRRTTARSSARATTRRPAGTARSTDPNGKLDIPKHAGYWLRDDKGELTKRMRHICWDGCMFPNAVMEKQETWNKVLGRDDQGARRARLAGVAAGTSPLVGRGSG